MSAVLSVVLGLMLMTLQQLAGWRCHVGLCLRAIV